MNLSTNLGVSMITGIFDTDASSATAIKKRAPFELRVGPFVNYELEVLSFRGKERVNDAYRYEVTFATEVDEDTLHASIFGAPGCLTVKAPGYDPRVLQGLVASIEGLGGVPSEQGTARRRYRLTIVPKLWLMKHRRKNRVFQQKSAVDIATLMLAEIGMAASESRWRVVDADYPTLPFVYQRNESDFDFFRRVLADAGIFFYFDHSSGLLDALVPTPGAAGAGEGASASVSIGLGGVSVSASAGATASGPAATSGTTVLNFAARATDTLAVMAASGGAAAAAPAPAASASIGLGGMGVSVSVGLGGVSASVSAGSGASTTDSTPSATISFDDGLGADPDDDRVYEFGLKKQLRTKALRLHERLLDTASNWVGEQVVVPPAPPSSAPSASASASFGGLSASVSVPGVSVSLGLGGVSASVGAAPAAAAGSVPFDLETTLVTPDVLRQERYQVDPGLSLGQTPGSISNPVMDLELARTRRRYVEAQGKSDCRRMGAGYRFTLADHPIQALNGEYTVVGLDSEGTHPDYATEVDHVYRNRFRCIPSTYAPLPPRPKKRPKLGIEMAKVVAYSDILKVPWLESSPNGYVKVRFQWDIVDKNGASTGMLQNGVKYTSGTEDNFAIWVPVMQPWAGAGYGTQFVPREGMDVIVGFLEDQGERPVILGCLYSGANPPPWSDQAGSQKVGIKSQTRAANGGFSELSIDDTQGTEVVTMTAQTDLKETVSNDRTLTVGGSRSASVAGTDSLHAVGSRTVAVDGTDTATIGGTANLTVKGDYLVSVAKDLTETITGDFTTTTTGAKVESVNGSQSLSVQSDLAENVGGDYSLRINGKSSIVVGEEEATDAYSDVYVYGNHTVGATGTLKFTSKTAIVFQCGSSIVSITPNAIQVASPSIAMAGQKRMFIAGAGPALTLSDQAELVGKTVTILSSAASLILDTNATIYGTAVSLGSGAPPAPAPDSTNPTLPTKGYNLVAKDGSGTPYANKNYSLLIDGNVTQGTTGADGSISATISANAVLAHLTVWTGAYPEGPRLRWDLALVDKLEPVDAVRGALDRLTNLGYYQGEVGDVLTDDGTVAIQRFQGDNGLPATGVLDAATSAQLSQSHGH